MEQEKKPRVWNIAEGAVRELEKLGRMLKTDNYSFDEDDEPAEDPDEIMLRVIKNLRRRNPEYNEEHRTRNREHQNKLKRDKRLVQKMRNVCDSVGHVYLLRTFFIPEKLVSFTPITYTTPEGPFVHDLQIDEQYQVPCRVCGLGCVNENGHRFVRVRLLKTDGTPTNLYYEASLDNLDMVRSNKLKLVDFHEALCEGMTNDIQWQGIYDKVERLRDRALNRRRWQARMNQQKDQEQCARHW